MKRYAFGLIFIICMCVAVNSQTVEMAIEQAKVIKLLETERSTIGQLLYFFKLDTAGENIDHFSWGDIDLEVQYSTGECDEDEEEVWQVQKGKVTGIVIEPSDVDINDVGLDLSTLKKEQIYSNDDQYFIFHDKKKGIAIKAHDNEVESIILFPSISIKTKTCDSVKAREFIKEKGWFGTLKLEDRTLTVCGYYTGVTTLTLSRNEVSALSDKKIEVVTTAVNPDGDPLTYAYTVSGGKIIGTGSRVVWDLTGVLPGKYTITAAVDDGCGFCGQPKTEFVTVK